MAQSKKSQSFEEALGALEDIVNRLDTGELGLEDALTAFEDGVKLVKQCQKTLTAAQQKVEILTENTSGETLTPFQTDDTQEKDS